MEEALGFGTAVCLFYFRLLNQCLSAFWELLEEKVCLERVELDCTQLREHNESVCRQVAEHATIPTTLGLGFYRCLESWSLIYSQDVLAGVYLYWMKQKTADFQIILSLYQCFCMQGLVPHVQYFYGWRRRRVHLGIVCSAAPLQVWVTFWGVQGNNGDFSPRSHLVACPANTFCWPPQHHHCAAISKSLPESWHEAG